MQGIDDFCPVSTVEKMLRLFLQRAAFRQEHTRLLTSVNNLQTVVVSRRTTTTEAQKTKQETESSQRDPEKVKRAKLYDVLIISSIGIIGFGYLIIRRLFSTQVHAKSVEGVSQENELSSLDESGKKDVLNDGESEGTPVQKKRKKTFRESKV